MHHPERCVWSFLMDGTSYRCQAKVGQFLGQLGKKSPRDFTKSIPLFVQYLRLKSLDLTNLLHSFKIKRLGSCNFQDLTFQSWTKKCSTDWFTHEI